MSKRKGTLLDPVTGLKQCAQCKQFKPASEFHKNKNTKDKLLYICKSCQKIK